jgi:thiol-disulfide isomerase/thioredoxin
VALLIVGLIIGSSIWIIKSHQVSRLPQQAKDIEIPTASTTSPVLTDRAKIIADKAKVYERAKELYGPTGFVNSEPFKLSDYVGKKVILLDFWTYSCINCQRTIPYLKIWNDKYKDKGLVIVGVHTPEFEFEKDINNVSEAVKRLGVDWPVVLDSNYGTWGAYGNQYWPHKYLIDIDGYVVYDHIGEGSYDATEREIQKALAERAEVLGQTLDVKMPISVPHADSIEAMSPETYFGSNRNQYFGNGTPGKPGVQFFNEPESVDDNKLYLIGKWNVTNEFAETASDVGGPNVGSDRIDYKYTAKGVYLVAGSSNSSVNVEVTIDGKPIESSIKGSDVIYKDGRSYVSINEKRLYRIVDGSKAETHLIEFIVSKPGLQVYTFTFG